MEFNRKGRRKSLGAVSLAVCYSATVLGVALLGRLWYPPIGRGGQVILAAALLALALVLGIVWQARARGARRWRAVLDAYAERELARDRLCSAERS